MRVRLSDSKAVLLTLNNPRICFKFILEILQTLEVLSTVNSAVSLVWLQGHNYINNFEVADALAR